MNEPVKTQDLVLSQSLSGNVNKPPKRKIQSSVDAAEESRFLSRSQAGPASSLDVSL